MKKTRRLARERSGLNIRAVLRLFPLLAFLIFLTPVDSQTALAHRTLRTVYEIQRLSKFQAGQSFPVDLQGVVTYFDPTWKIVFVQDSTGPVFLSIPAGNTTNYPAYSRVRLQAVAVVGNHAWNLTKPVVHLIGPGVAPKAPVYSISDLNASVSVSSFVTTEGVLRPCDQKMDRICYRIFDGRSMAWVIIPQPVSPASQSLIGMTVRLKGACGMHPDASGKLAGAQLYVNGLDAIEKTDNTPIQSFASPAMPIADLHLADAEERLVHPVHIRGTVTWTSTQQAMLQDASGSTSIKTLDVNNLHLGDMVDVVGFPGEGELTPVVLSDAIARMTQNSPIGYIAPRDVTAQEIARRSLYGFRVRLRARLIGHDDRAGENIYYFSAGKERFSGRMPTSNTAQITGLPNGSYVELTGVAAMRRTNVKQPESFQLLMESPSDIALDRNGWFSIEHLLMVASALGLVVCAVLIWVTMLRRTVRKQTEIIRSAMESELQLASQYQRLFERNLAPVFRWHPDGSFVDFNMAFVHLLGMSEREQMAACNYWEFEDDPEKREELRASLLKKETQSNRDASLRRVDGVQIHLLMNISPVETPKGTIYETTAIDISDLQHRQTELQKARDAAVVESLSDPLTGLPNRRMVTENLTLLMHQLNKDGGLIGLLFIDLDGFKTVNDNFGHSAGDLLLIEVAERLRARVRQNDVVARLGGDEFLVILKEIRAREEAARVAAVLLQALSIPLLAEGNSLAVSASIGISVYPETASDAEELIRQADCAMYAAKRNGKNRLVNYSTEIEAQASEPGAQ
jgi:diguanylate cyclase (GGDEF)-like protein/PAS domain S-box-containing protein